jgi:hypothetical protein
LTAAEASRNPKLRQRVALAADTTDRTVSDLLRGYAGLASLVERIHRALASEHVDMATIPKRTPAEVLAWKRGRQRCAACERKDTEIAGLRSQLAALRGQQPAKVNGSKPAGITCVPCDDSGIEVAAE